MSFLKSSAFAAMSCAVAFAGVTSAQTQQSTLVPANQGFVKLTFNECYKARDVAGHLEKKRGELKTGIKGEFGGNAAVLYANVATGSYSIVLDIKDDRKLNTLTVEEYLAIKGTDRMLDYTFSCIVDSEKSGYPDKALQSPIYKEIFWPK